MKDKIKKVLRGMIFSVLRMILLVGCVPPRDVPSVDSRPSQDETVPREEYSQADKILREMTVEEKVGQLFWIRPDALDTTAIPPNYYGRKNATEVMLDTMNRYPAGGIVFFAENLSGREELKAYMEQLRSGSWTPPVFAVDEEGGTVSRIAGNSSFGIKNMPPMGTIGKSGDPSQAYRAGEYIGGYLKELGFCVDFAPVADINTNPNNIVIGNRAFGKDPRTVSSMVSSFLDGLHSREIAGCMKHFPGHGDTSRDTHYGYVAVTKTWEQLHEAELIPFIDNKNKTDLIMIAHLTLPKITSDGLPASLSYEFVTGKLRNELGYDGLIITDALAMGAINNSYSSEKACVLAINSGVDVLLMPFDYVSAYEGVVEAVRNGEIPIERLDESVLRILELKEKYGLI